MNKGLAIVIGKGKSDPEAEGTEEDGGGDYLDLLADILKVHESDKEDFAAALKGFVSECSEA